MSKHFHFHRTIWSQPRSFNICFWSHQCVGLVLCWLGVGTGAGGVQTELKLPGSFYLPSWDLHLPTPSFYTFFFKSMKYENLKASHCTKSSPFIANQEVTGNVTGKQLPGQGASGKNHSQLPPCEIWISTSVFSKSPGSSLSPPACSRQSGVLTLPFSEFISASLWFLQTLYRPQR